MNSTTKKRKLSDSAAADKDEKKVATCQYFVIRKKRLCKMTVAKGKKFCGEHQPNDTNEKNDMLRIPCPLDPKHTVYKIHLQKHLKICNARPKETNPPYIKLDINAGSDDEDLSDLKFFKLSHVPDDDLLRIIGQIENLYHFYVEGNIDELFLQHNLFEKELEREDCGRKTVKHISQTAAIIGCLEHFELLKDETTYIEFGAGKGQMSYWLAKLITEQHHSSSVVLLDRASHRHKKDNKVEDKSLVYRIRTDIKDFNLKELNVLKTAKNVVAVSKHLCGSATDLTFRCLLLGTISGFVITLCCHHRCEWKSFVGKQFFMDNGLKFKDFILITKMASWAICGTGKSKERRVEKATDDEIMKHTYNIPLDKRQEIGRKCKRLLDYSRLVFMESKGFECSLKYYVTNDITLENVCIVGIKT